MQTSQQFNQPTDPQLATLERIEKLLVKIDNKLRWIVALIILAMLWTFLQSAA